MSDELLEAYRQEIKETHDLKLEVAALREATRREVRAAHEWETEAKTLRERVAQLEAESAQLNADAEEERRGNLQLRAKYGARENETMWEFVRRLATGAEPPTWADVAEAYKRAPSRRIVCSAIIHKASSVLICGARHHDCLHSPFRTGELNEWRQGFIDQFNRFLTREDAWEVATRQNQIVRRCGGDEGRLFSENLY